MVNNALTYFGGRRVRREDAETTALQALAWIAEDREMLRHFCAATGMEPEDLGAAAREPEFLAGVLDFLCLDDAWVRDFARATGTPPEAAGQARSALPGGDLPHWT